MKTNVTISVDTSLITEVRGVGGLNVSAICEEALRKELKIAISPEKQQLKRLQLYQDLKDKVRLIGGLRKDEVLGAIRQVKYLGFSSNTLEEKIAFWQEVVKVLEDLQESTPEPPKEGGDKT